MALGGLGWLYSELVELCMDGVGFGYGYGLCVLNSRRIWASFAFFLQAGKPVGGFTDGVEALHKEGKLVPMLKEAGAL